MMTSCYQRMLKYMAGITWRAMVGYEEVARRCSVRQVHDVIAGGIDMCKAERDMKHPEK